MSDFICIGVPYFLGEKLDEPNAITTVRDSGFAQNIGAEWIDIVPDETNSPDPITAVNRALAEVIAINRDCFPIIFASDCVTSIGAAKGIMSENRLGVLWFDAHGDFNTPETTPSGFLGGMPLAMLVGRGNQNLMEGVELQPLDETDIILTDARDLDPGEAVTLRQSSVRHFANIHDLLTAPLPAKPLYVHLDIDVVNPDEMPAMSYLATGGPSLADTVAALERVARDGQVVALLLGLWDASRATDDRPLHGTLRLTQALINGLDHGNISAEAT